MRRQQVAEIRRSGLWANAPVTVEVVNTSLGTTDSQVVQEDVVMSAAPSGQPRQQLVGTQLAFATRVVRRLLHG